MRPFLIPVTAALALCLSGCGEQVRYTYTKILANATEFVTLNDKETLESTSGVAKAIVSSPDHNNMITLQLFLDEDNPNEGRRKALELGYKAAAGQ